MNMSIGKKITGGFLLVIISVVCMNVFTFWKLGKLDEESKQMNTENTEKMQLILGIASDLANEAVVMRRFNFTGDEADIPMYNEYKQAADNKMNRLEQLVVTEKGKQLLGVIKNEKAAYEVIGEKSMQAKREKNIVLVTQSMQEAGRPYKAANAATAEMVKAVNEFVKKQEQQFAQEKKRTQMLILTANAFIALMAIAIGLLISQMITKPITEVAKVASRIAEGDLTHQTLQISSNDEIGQLAQAFQHMSNNLRQLISKVASSAESVGASSEELTAGADQSAQAANQVATSISDIARSAETQLKVVGETSGIVQNMSAGIAQIAASANQVASGSAKASETANTGVQSIEKAVNQMAQIEDTVNASADMVSKLGERSKEIGQIVTTISGIAGQTNLLALNAAIEAARAGEQGRGFAVVAEEVRKLAEQSDEAAKQIATLITEVQGETDKAVAAMNDGSREVRVGTEVVNNAGQAFTAIVSLVNQVSSQVNEISAAIQQLASGSQQIVVAVKDINSSSQDTAEQMQSVLAATQEQSASTEEIASSSQALSRLAEELQVAISTFKI